MFTIIDIIINIKSKPYYIFLSLYYYICMLLYLCIMSDYCLICQILIEQKNKNPRKITPRKASRLQGFPKNYIIPVSDTQSYKQFVNSIAVPVIYNIDQNILQVLEL